MSDFDFADEPGPRTRRRREPAPRGPFMLGFLIALGVLTALLLFSCLFGGPVIIFR